VEITLTTPNALECIRQARIELGHRVVVGAGSVLNLLQAREALDAGADFLVTPITRTSLVAAAHDRDCPVMIGALTPTEAQQAHEAGADFVKLFPADQLGPAYVKALRAPLPHLRLVPTGGVTLENARQFLEAGAALLGLGSSLIPEAIWETRDWDDLTRRAELLMSRLRTTA
jgi:2-dehydro-3-deoxyphosphogluconate aldolase / (4S)-4-hydroxy-2-oxoglutarate aldolase